MEKKSLACQALEHCVVMRQGTRTPLDVDWDEHIEVISKAEKEYGKVCVLVFSDGSSPDGGQRKRLKLAFQGSQMQVAVMSSSAAVRFVVSSLTFINKSIRCFTHDELKEALAHLDVSPSIRARVPNVLTALKEQIDSNLGK